MTFAPSTIWQEITCPPTPRHLGLDKDSWRAGQRETIDMIMHAFVEEGKKFVVAGIPTGGGKTIVAAAVQKLLANATDNSTGGQFGGDSLALTHTIHLQHQYAETLKDAALVTGRGNHPCALPDDSEWRIGTTDAKPLMADDAPCGQGEGCPEDRNKFPGGCDYYAQYFTAREAPMVVMNYAYAVRVLNIPQKGKKKNPFHRDLLVADECHLAHDALIDAAGVKIWCSSLTKCGIRLPDGNTKIEVMEGGPRSQQRKWYENVAVWQQWARDSLPIINAGLEKAQDDFDSLKQIHDNVTQTALQGARGQVKSLKALSEAMGTIAYISNPDEWIIRRDSGQRSGATVSITAQPLWGRSFAKPMLFNHFKRVLLMSATPGDANILRWKLGISEDEMVFLDRPSYFPVENRPVVYWPVVKLNYNSDENDWDLIARAIGWIATRPQNVGKKGLVHSGSKKNADKLVRLLDHYLGGGRAFSHGEGHEHTRESALEEFTAAREPRILVTASFTTGLDLPYVIGWQVIAKVPFGSLADEITSRRRAFRWPNGYAFGQQDYQAACANTVIQAAGRIVRSETDSGPTFVLDGSFGLLYKMAYFPQFFKDAYRVFSLET